MSNRGVPLRVIQKISGHSSLEVLQRYLEVSDQQIGDAVGVLGDPIR
jgi:integrase/recombinase XerD